MLQTTGGIAVAGALANVVLPHVHAAENNTIQVALVGCGGRGTGAAENALSVKDGPIKLVAMADVFPERLASSYKQINKNFAKRVEVWRQRTKGTEFFEMDYRGAMKRATKGDLVYCDPPYKATQSILYGAQDFDLAELFETIHECKSRGVFVALSLDGTKKTGNKVCDVRIPADLFEREVLVNCGRSMLRRFQMGGQTLEGEVVADRLLLAY